MDMKAKEYFQSTRRSNYNTMFEINHGKKQFDFIDITEFAEEFASLKTKELEKQLQKEAMKQLSLLDQIKELEEENKKLKIEKETTHEKWELGICPKCGASMFDKFSANIHDVERCGRKKAVTDNFENA